MRDRGWMSGPKGQAASHPSPNPHPPWFNELMRLISVLVFSAALLSAADLKLGKPLTVKEAMPLATLLAKPADYVGKTVQVKGKIVEVNDGEIEFPKESSGKSAIAEGTLAKLELSKEEAVERARHEAEEKHRKFD